MPLVRRIGLLLVVAAFCRLPATRTQAAEPANDRNVAIVTMDGLRWQEVFGGAQEKLMDDRAGGVRDLDGLRKRYWRDTPEARREAVLPFFLSSRVEQGQNFLGPAVR